MTIKNYISRMDSYEWIAIATYDGLDDFIILFEGCVLRVPQVLEKIEIERESTFSEWLNKDYPLLII